MTHSSPRQFLLTPPQDLEQARATGLPLGLMAWQLDPRGRLAAAPLPPQARGALMLVGSSQPIQGGEPRRTAQEILNQCRLRGCAGVILDLEQPPSPFLAQLIRQVEEGLAQRQGALFLPESYGKFSRRAGIYLSSALSGGSLRRRLDQAVEQYGPQRVVLCLRRSREDFYLPALEGKGRPLTQEALDRLRRRLEPRVFFSPALCARYFTYMSRETGAHFVLFDDGETLLRKREAALEAGIRRFFLLYPEVADVLPQLGQAGPEGA